jgi:hypothetical protein
MMGEGFRRLLTQEYKGNRDCARQSRWGSPERWGICTTRCLAPSLVHDCLLARSSTALVDDPAQTPTPT